MDKDKSGRKRSGTEADEDLYMAKENNLEGLSRKEKFAQEWKKLSGLSWRQRIGYLWDYYKIVPVILIAVIFLISLTVNIVHGLNMEQVLQAVFVNSDSLRADTDRLEQDFAGYLGGMEKNQELMFDYSLTLDLEGLDTGSAAAITKITAYSMNGKLDCMILPEDIYLDYVGRGMFMRLEDVLDEEEQEAWREALDERKQPEDTERFAYGVRLDGAGVLEDYGLYGGRPVYLAIPGNAAQTEMTVKFLHFLMGEEASAADRE